MKKIKRPYPSIVEASFPKRLGALLIDLLATIAIGLVAYMAIDGIFHQTPVGGHIDTRLFSLKQASGLYIADGETETTYLLEGDINDEVNSHYLPRLTHYYLLAKDPSDNSKLFSYADSTFYKYGFAFDFYDMVLKRGQEDCLFDFTGEEQITFAFKDSVSFDERQAEWIRLYNQAIDDFENCEQYLAARKPLGLLFLIGGGFGLAIGAIPPILIIPLVLGNGQTIGKYILGLALVSKSGHQVKKGAIVIRYFVFGFFEIGASLGLYAMPLFISSAAVTVTNSNRALHDLLAGTYVVDARQSKIFSNEEDEKRYYAEKTSAEEQSKIPFFQMPPKTIKRS